MGRRRTRVRHQAGWFIAVTWNLKWSVRAKRHRRKIRAALRRGVSLFYLQEFEAPGIQDVFEAEGLVVIKADRRALAYDPQIWREVKRKRGPARRLAERAKTYWSSGSVVNTDAAEAILEHLPTGHRLLARSIHTPSAIERGGRPAGRRSGLAVLREAMGTLRRTGRRIVGSGRADAEVDAGDDNSDGSGHEGAWESYNGTSVSGLREIKAPAPTHGHGRRIDDFRVDDGVEVGSGWVMGNLSDHNMHGRRLRFKGEPRERRARKRYRAQMKENR